MNKSMKNKVVSVLTFVMCAMLALFIGLNVNFAKAETPTATDTNVFTLGNREFDKDKRINIWGRVRVSSGNWQCLCYGSGGTCRIIQFKY